jgi:tricorn protease
VKTPNLHEGRIVYQLATDLHIFDVASSQDKKLDIQISSDFDHLRERWITKPLEFTTSVNLSHDGSRIAFTSRGRVFTIPAKQGRLVDVTPPKARFREGQLLPDGKSLLTLSSESGELEWYKFPANGVGAGERLTTDGNVLRWGAKVSPDGTYAAHSDKNNNLWLLNLTTKEQKKIVTANPTTNSSPAFDDLAWSPDSRWLTYSTEAANTFDQIWLYGVSDGSLTPLTSNRYNSGSAAWSADGKWIYFLSDRSLRTNVPAPWGARAPDPNFDRSFKIYQIPLQKDLRSPFEPADETQAAEPAKKPDAPKADAKVVVTIDLAGIATRLSEVPVPPGNYRSLTAPGKRLCFINGDRSEPAKTALQCLDIANKGEKAETLFEGIRSYQLSGDSSKIMLVKGEEFYVVDATARPAALAGKGLSDARVNLAGWTFSVLPQEEFREALNDAWRLHRDYFYDRNMHGVNWKLMKDKYGELVGRVRDRSELSDLLGQMISELNVLHNSVRGGDLREAPDQIRFGTLGARLLRDTAAGGWRVDHIYQHDPDRPDRASPLAQPNVNVRQGDVLLSINGQATLAATHPHELLRNQAGKPVLLRVKTGSEAPRDVVVKALSTQADADLRYHEWEYTRRLEVESKTKGRMGYVHLRAMGPNDINQWTEEYYPIFDREGLIIDVRHNNGGNIDSWILGKLLRKAWMFWQPRVGNTRWNMQYAFRGPIVVLVDERTASDGEAFADGFRRLGLGKVIGTRTWGGEVWLTSSNTLADSGIASAAEIGVYGPEREWLIEGVGVIPDIVVDNLPHATFNGKDAQLEAAIQHLDQLVKQKPNPVPGVPAYPDKSKM